MNLDSILLLTVVTLALAGFVQSLTGFGFGLVAMALLPLLGAIYAGNRLLRRIQREHLRVVVFVFLLVIGIKYIFKL